jgi:hypothetical protein
LRLDWCWRRWRTSAKGHCRWGLQLWRRQVGLVQRDPLASRVKCRPHGGKNSEMKSWTVSWLSLKTKVEPRLHGSRLMSADWWRLHRICGISSGSPENHWVPWLFHKAKTEEPKTEVQQHRTGLIGGFD